MKFRTFKQNKLWRDKAVELMEQMGSKIHWHKLNDADFAQELKVKFIEEAQEVCNAQATQAVIEELADILEVMTAFGNLHGFSLHDVMQVQHKKKEQRGGFAGRTFVTKAEHLVDSYGEKYCLADAQKYPEIVEE